MNKKILLLPLLSIMALTGCREASSTSIESKESTSEKTSELTSEVTSEKTSEVTSEKTSEATSEKTSEATSAPTSEATSQASEKGTSKETAFTIDEMLEFMKDYQDGQISPERMFITGKVASSSYNSTYNSYSCYFEGHDKDDQIPVMIYSGVLKNTEKTYKEVDAMKDAVVVVQGYLKLYQGTYECAYVSLKESPSGLAYSPYILSVTGGTPDYVEEKDPSTENTVAGANASTTGDVPENAKTITFDFRCDSIEGITSDTVKSPDKSGVAKLDDYEFNYGNVCKGAANEWYDEGYIGLAAKGAGATAYIANKTAIPGKIVKVSFTMPKGKSVSALAPFVIHFGNEACQQTYKTTGQTGGSGVSMSAYSTIDASYFAISVIQGISTSGKATYYNGLIADITVTYVD